MMTAKIGTTVHDRSDWFGQVAQKAKWISPLHSSRRDDQNAHMKRPIWALDERFMTSGRLHPNLTGHTG
jgi:hypothetical protein